MTPRRVLLAVLLLGLGSASSSQVPPSRYLAKHWTTEDGLPAHTVTGLVQAENGFLWISTTGGIARFDGRRFKVYTARDGSGLPSSRFNGLAGGRGDTLWAVTEQGHLILRAGGRFRVAGTMETGGPQSVGIDQDGRLHTSLSGRLVASGETRPASTPVRGALARGPSGTLWVQCAGDRLCRVRGSVLTPVGASGVEHVVQGPGHPISLRRAGGRWAASDESGRSHGTFPARGQPMRVDRQGQLWIVEGATLRVAGRDAAQPTERFDLPSSAVSGVVEDREGILWVMTRDAGLVSVRETPFMVYSERQGLPQGPVITPTADATGPLASVPNGDLYRLWPDRVERLSPPMETAYGAVTDALGTRWVFGERLVGEARDGVRWTLAEEAVQVLPAQQQRQRPDQRLWVRAEGEVLEVAPYGASGPVVLRRIPAPESRSMTLGPDGVVWVPTNRGLIRIGPERIRRLTTAEGLPTDFIRSVHISDDGAVWIGTYGGGLARLLNGQIRVLDARQGLAEDVVSSLFEDASGMFWMGGNQSIHRVRRADAEAVLEGRAPLALGIAYGRKDGLLNPEGSGWPALQKEDGTLLFPTFEGVAVLVPSRALALEEVTPEVHIEGVRVQDGEVTLGLTDLAAEERRFTVAFTAASFRAPDRVQFQYRLDGFDPDWVGPLADHEATYTNVPPGTYTFRVRARAYDGEWSEDARTTLSVAPFVWETLWFRLLAGLCVLAGLGLIVLWRIQRLTARQRELDALVVSRTAALAAEKETVAMQAAELRTLDEAKSRLFANVSHEFRTPLQLILGPLADVHEGRYGALSPEARAQIGLASRNGRRLLALVEQLLALARSDAGVLEMEPVRLDAAAFAARVAEAFRPLAEREGIAFETDLSAAKGTFDPVAVETALANLLANAFSFTPSGGTVTLRLTPASGAVPLVFRVTDTGPGLAAEQAARVFDRFYQADDSPTRRGSGTGIGLSLVREIAELHGGWASVESTPGRGCTFVLALPEIADAPEAEATPDLRLSDLFAASGDGMSLPLPRSPEAPEDTPRVLVVDDNADLRALVRRHLDDRYAVDEAASGDEALVLARTRLPDAIVSDVMMPGLDGIGLVREIRADPETDFVPVLLLTARATVPDTVEGLGAGADDYLAKPFDARELRARVDGLIASRQRLRERWKGAAPEANPLPVALASGASAEQRDLVRRLVETVDARIDDDSLSVDDLARAVGVSRSTLYRRLSGVLNGSAADLLRDVRLARAAGLLARGAGTVSEIAYGVGFKSVSHFSACFRERYGATPSAYGQTPEAH